MRKAFTLIELIFVIVIIGILASIAMPKLSATRDDAVISVTAKKVYTIMEDMAAYAIANGDLDGSFITFSNVLEEMANSGEAVYHEDERNATMKAGDIFDCITFAIVTGVTEQNLTLTLGEADDDVICKGVQDRFDLENFPIILRGRVVKF